MAFCHNNMYTDTLLKIVGLKMSLKDPYILDRTYMFLSQVITIEKDL